MDSDKNKCSYPKFMSYHHDWQSVDGLFTIHVNKRGHSVKLRNHTRLSSVYDVGATSYLESHATCLRVEHETSRLTRMVAHVKAGW